MPILPSVDRRPGAIDVPRYPRGSGFGEFGKALSIAADTFAQVQAGADAAEITKLTGEGTENLNIALQKAEQENADPETYKAAIVPALDDAYASTLAQATNDRVRKRVEANLANNRLQATQLAELGYFKKKKDTAEGNWVVSMNQVVKQAVAEPDAARRDEIVRGLFPLIEARIKNGFTTHAQAAKDALAIEKAVQSGRMELEARQTPEKFTEDVEKGAWATADGVALQRALDMAGKVSDAKARRDAAAGKVQDDDNYRNFEKQAEERKLNLADLESKAARWGWDKNKVDRLKNMQMGLRSANPDEAKAIFEAMRPVALEIRPTAKQIDDVDRALNRLAQDRSVSVDTTEFREAKEKLRGLSHSLSVQGDIKERQSEFDARSDVHTLYNKYFPGPKDERMIAEMADHVWKLRTMSRQERDSYIDGLAKKLEKDRAGKRDSRTIIDGLRGLGNK